MEAVFRMTIAELIEAYRTRQVSPVEVVQATLLQLEAWEPHINAFISVFADAALRAAKLAETQYISGNATLPLLGVPVSVKDLVESAGHRTTCASRILKSNWTTRNAPVYQKIFDSGAIVVGKTNLLEFAYGAVHPDYGQTNNPYDTAHTSGGSSSGSAASVAANIGFASLGTDTGGSIRIPAAYCGVIGLKPTYGLVDVEGVFPLSKSLDHVGPIARTTTDIAYFFDAMTGGHAPSAVAFLGQCSAFKVVGILPDAYLHYAERAVKDVYRKAIDQLTAMGLSCRYLTDEELRDFERAEDILMRILLPEAAQIHRRWWNQGSDYATITYEQIAEGKKRLAVDYLAAVDEHKAYRQRVDEWFTRYDVILTPTVDFAAPMEDPPIGDETMNEMRYTGIWNVSGHPAVSLNGGYAQNELPIGIQLAGRRYADGELIGFARCVEEQMVIRRDPQLPLDRK